MNHLISPLRYSGGKSRLYKQIKQYFPKDKNVMIDLFFGGGSVGLNWLTDNPNHKILANDIDTNLINFWLIVKNHVDNLISWKHLVKQKGKTKEIFNSNNYPFWIDFLVKNKCSFNGIGTFSELAFKQNFNISTFKRIENCSQLLKRAELHNLDYKELIVNKELDAFFYLDPPYLIPNVKKLYKNSNFNHYELANLLKNIKTQWILSINDCSEIRKLYKNFNIYEIDAIYSSSNSNSNKCKRVKELVITNFPKE